MSQNYNRVDIPDPYTQAPPGYANPPIAWDDTQPPPGYGYAPMPPEMPPPPGYEIVNVATPDTTTIPFQQRDIGQIGSNDDYISKEALVDTQLGRILKDDNPYIKAARDAALKQMNAKGLLNSSMAVNSSQDAAIEAAMPIAQQNAQLYGKADLNRQGVDIAGVQNTQQAAYQWDAANQRYVNDLGKMQYQGNLSASDLLFKHNMNMVDKNYDVRNKEWLMGREYGYRSVADDDAFKRELIKLDKNYDLQGKLAEQKGNIALVLDQAKYEFQSNLEMLKLDNNTRMQLQQQAVTLTQKYLDQYAAVMSDPNISDDKEPNSGLSYRQLALNTISQQYQMALSGLTGLASGALGAIGGWYAPPSTDPALDSSSWTITYDDGTQVGGSFRLRPDGTGYDIVTSDGNPTTYTSDLTPMYNQNIGGNTFSYVWGIRDNTGTLKGYVAKDVDGNNYLIDTDGNPISGAGWTQPYTPPGQMPPAQPPTQPPGGSPPSQPPSQPPPGTPPSQPPTQPPEGPPPGQPPLTGSPPSSFGLPVNTWTFNGMSGDFSYRSDGRGFDIVTDDGTPTGYILDARMYPNTTVGDYTYDYVFNMYDSDFNVVGFFGTRGYKNYLIGIDGTVVPGGTWN